MEKYLNENNTITKVILPCVMLFQRPGAYFKSWGRPRNVAKILQNV